MAERFDPEEFVARYSWRFAKSMPGIPHFYVVRGKPVPDAEFDAFKRQVQENGYRARWNRYEHTYLELGDWRYWVLEPVINRERLEESVKSTDEDEVIRLSPRS